MLDERIDWIAKLKENDSRLRANICSCIVDAIWRADARQMAGQSKLGDNDKSLASLTGIDVTNTEADSRSRMA